MESRLIYWAKIYIHFKRWLEQQHVGKQKMRHIVNSVASWIINCCWENPELTNNDLFRSLQTCELSLLQLQRELQTREININLNPLFTDIKRLSVPQINNFLTDNQLQIKINTYVLTLSKTPQLQYLLDNYDIDSVAACCIRYALFSLDNHCLGHQLALSSDVGNGLPEAFASPLNVRDPHLKYCSAFLDDVNVGSLGNFFQLDLSKFASIWICNPPFTELVLEATVRQLLRFRTELAGSILNLPAWEDSTAYHLMMKSGCSFRLISKQEHNYYKQDQVWPAHCDAIRFIL